MTDYEIHEMSHSHLLHLQTCGEYYRRRHLEMEYRPGTLRMHRGSTVHSVAAEGHKRQYAAKRDALAKPPPIFDDRGLALARIEPRLAAAMDLRRLLTSVLPSKEEAADLAATDFDRRVAEGVTVTPEDVAEAGGEKLAIGKTKDMVVDLSKYYTTDVAPTINPLGFERRIRVKPRDQPDLAVRGILDLIEEEQPFPGSDELPKVIVTDLKTGEKSPNPKLAMQDQQLTMQAMLHQADTGRLPDAEILRYVIRTPKRHELKRIDLRTVVTPQDVRALVARLNAAVEGIRKGVFIPAAPGHWKCSARWCEYWRDCRFALRRE